MSYEPKEKEEISLEKKLNNIVMRDIATAEGIITIYGSLIDVSMDAEGNLVIYLSKKNKEYLKALCRFLRKLIGLNIHIRIQQAWEER